MNSPQTDAAGQPAQHSLHRGLCGPRISSSHRDQAWFFGEKGSGDVFGIDPYSSGIGAHASVYRRTTTSFVELSLGITGIGEFKCRLGAATLRELAARLLDAAHDLDTYPAGTDRQPTNQLQEMEA